MGSPLIGKYSKYSQHDFRLAQREWRIRHSSFSYGLELLEVFRHKIMHFVIETSMYFSRSNSDTTE
jgi:hypothetical protein